VDFQYKFLERFFIVFFVLLFSGCAAVKTSPFLYPWRQVEYSYDDQIKILKNQVTRENAMGLLKIHILGAPSAEDAMMILSEDTIARKEKTKEIYLQKRKNLIINNEGIAYDDVREKWVFLRESGDRSIYKYDSDNSVVPLRVKFGDVKMIKLFECTQVNNSLIYQIILYYGEDKKSACFQFTIPPRENQLEQAQRLVAALLILTPHAKEEYNKERFMVPPSIIW
jgi:hypothetical protein